MPQASAVMTARPEHREAALRLLFAHLDSKERDRRVANALHLMELGKLDAEGLFIAQENDVLCGSMICLSVPGASGLVWPPQTKSVVNASRIEDQLVQHTCTWLKSRGVRLGQALLAADETKSAGAIERNGFQH